MILEFILHWRWSQVCPAASQTGQPLDAPGKILTWSNEIGEVIPMCARVET